MTNDGSNTLVYDAENRLLSATNGSSSGTYTYDGNNLRVKKVSGSTTTVYIFSGPQVIAEYDNGAAVGSPSREYIRSGADLVAKIDSSGTKYYHQDHLSNRLLTDSNGNKLAEMGHYPFGESWYNASSDKLLFTSYTRDSESGNDYAMMRSYVNRLARFSSPDLLSGALANPQSLNRFSYTGNEPIDFVDPSGELMYWGGGGTAQLYGPITNDSGNGLFGGALLDSILSEAQLVGGKKGGGGRANFEQLKAKALRALETNPDCAPLFGGFANALNSLFGTSYNIYTAGETNPFPDKITPNAWGTVVDAFKNPGNYGYSLGYPPGTPYGIIFFGNQFSNFDSGFGTSPYQLTQMTGFFHELEHVANQIGAQNYKFTGYERDSETGLDYAIFRYYNSRVGRFMTTDPIDGSPQNSQSWNAYTFVHNNPSNSIDPIGMDAVLVYWSPLVYGDSGGIWGGFGSFSGPVESVGGGGDLLLNLLWTPNGYNPCALGGCGGASAPAAFSPPSALPARGSYLDWAGNYIVAVGQNFNPFNPNGAFSLEANAIGQSLGGMVTGNWAQVASSYDNNPLGLTAKFANSRDPLNKYLGYYGTRGTLIGSGVAATSAGTLSILDALGVTNLGEWQVGWKGGEFTLKDPTSPFKGPDFRFNPTGDWKNPNPNARPPHWHQRPGIGRHLPWEWWF